MSAFPESYLWGENTRRNMHTHTQRITVFWKIHDIVVALTFSLFLRSVIEIQFTYHYIHLFKVDSSEVYIILTPYRVVQPSTVSNFKILAFCVWFLC